MKLLWVLFLGAALSGCSSLPSMGNLFADDEGAEGLDSDGTLINKLTQAKEQEDGSGSDAIDAFGARYKSDSSQAYSPAARNLHVSDYVRNMAHDLVENMEYVTERTPVAVTHFALVDSDLKQTNLLGKQMAESFVHEFHQFRMPVVEYKATQYISVTDSGDFVMSRDFLDLNNTTPIQYVLTGTLTKHQAGFLVNARMLGMKSNVVVASAQSFIPYYVVESLMPSGASGQGEIVDGVRLIQGE